MKWKWTRASQATPPEHDAGIMRKLGAEKMSETVIVTLEVTGQGLPAAERYVAKAYTLDGKWRCDRARLFEAGGYDVAVVAWTPFPGAYDGET